MKGTTDVSQNVKASQQTVSESVGRRALRRLLSRKMTRLCLAIVALYTLIMVMGYLGLLPDFQTRYATTYEPPSFEFAKLLGTDIFGRSILFKVLAGTKTAMTIALFVTVITVPIGMITGSVAGYYGGKIDAFIAWAYTILSSIPNILLLVGISYAVSTLFGPKTGEPANPNGMDFGMVSICVAMGAVGWIGLCRLIRADVMKHKTMEYVLAVRLLGASDLTIIFRHILPNVFHLAIVSASLSMLGAIKFEVILTYLGVGVKSDGSWGMMIAYATGELASGIWWPLLSVSIAMFLILYALNVVGDALRDALDPKLVY
jgi:ABC-type dipeptide/oligopeptide/nickel transport system permease subunit